MPLATTGTPSRMATSAAPWLRPGVGGIVLDALHQGRDRDSRLLRRAEDVEAQVEVVVAFDRRAAHDDLFERRRAHRVDRVGG